MFPFLHCLIGSSEAILKISSSNLRILNKSLVTNEIIQNLARRMFISALIIAKHNW